MSEMSLLWHEYRRFNELARDITDDVILLQRVRLCLPGHETVTPEQVETSRMRARAIRRCSSSESGSWSEPRPDRGITPAGNACGSDTNRQ